MKTIRKRMTQIGVVCLLLCMAACREDTSYAERNAKLLAWLDDEKEILCALYTKGDTLTFLTDKGDTTWFSIAAITSNAEPMSEKGTWYRPEGRKTEIIQATCTLSLSPITKEEPSVDIYAHAWIDLQRDEADNPIMDGKDYLYEDTVTIKRYTKTCYWPRRDTSTIIETTPPYPLQDNEYLYLTPIEERSITLREWALIRKGEGVIKMADAYGHTWEAIR